MPGPSPGASEPARPVGHGWLVSPRWDVSVFGGSALLAALLLLWGYWKGGLDRPLPTWAWVVTVVFVDVAHVWATAYRVYWDPAEVVRRSGLYLLVPVFCYAAGVTLYSASGPLFWRVLAYTAVFHFVRQQYGWVALYRRRLGSGGRLDRVLDNAAIYSATLYPLVYWHAHLPREFEWFLSGDFLPGLPTWVAELGFPLHIGITVAYVARQAQLWLTARPVSAGKNLVVLTTWLTWYVGIVVFNSDYVFTLTNVLVHGIPYIAFVWVYGRRHFHGRAGWLGTVFRRGAWPLYLAPLLLAAWFEEWAWDRSVWHEHGALFWGPALLLSPAVLVLVVPLLALPQSVHYVLDAWIWRVRSENPGLAGDLGLPELRGAVAGREVPSLSG
jgi:hypothetical protein